MEEDITSALLSWGSVQPYKSKVRKWDERDITIKLENLKKKLGVWPVEQEINFQRHYTNNKVDYLNMAYYSLKDKFSKINRSKYGMVRQVEYERKERRRDPYETVLLGGGMMIYTITQLGQPITLLPPQIHNTRTLTQTLIVCIQAQLDFILEDFKFYGESNSFITLSL